MDNLIANKKSKIYHDSSCYFGNLVLIENRIDLDPDFTDSNDNSFRACSKCQVSNNNLNEWPTLDEFKKLKQNNNSLAEVLE